MIELASGGKRNMFDRILLPLDISEMPEIVVPYAEELAGKFASEIILHSHFPPALFQACSTTSSGKAIVLPLSISNSGNIVAFEINVSIADSYTIDFYQNLSAHNEIE